MKFAVARYRGLVETLVQLWPMTHLLEIFENWTMTSLTA
jgi:hypothetical protein